MKAPHRPSIGNYGRKEKLDAPKERDAFLGRLKKAGFRHWHDDSIELLQDWQQELEKRNEESTVFISLISNGYFSSYWCVYELRKALDNHKLIIFATIDNTDLSMLRNDIKFDNDGNIGEPVEITAKELAHSSIANNTRPWRIFSALTAFSKNRPSSCASGASWHGGQSRLASSLRTSWRRRRMC